MAIRLKLSIEQKSHLEAVKKIIVREYVAELLYIIRYKNLINDKMLLANARIIILTIFCKKSTLYKLIFGDKVPDILAREGHKAKQISNIKDNKSKKPVNLNAPSDDPLNMSSFKENEIVLFSKKLHIHLRIHLNVLINILSPKANTIENTLEIHDVCIDAFKPYGCLRTQLHINLGNLSISFNKDLFKTIRQPKMVIFDDVQNQKNGMPRTEAVSENLFELKPTSIFFEFNIEEGQKANMIIITYSNVKIGQLIYNYVPVVFKSFARNLIKLSFFYNRSFNTKIKKTIEKDDMKCDQEGNIVKAKEKEKSKLGKNEKTVQEEKMDLLKRSIIGGSSHIGYKEFNPIVVLDKSKDSIADKFQISGAYIVG